jgi:hypothetical protein
MTRPHIPRALRRRIVDESRGQCAYCHTPTAITGARFVIDHIIPDAAGGGTVWENSCLSCHSCNEFKAARRDGRDPLSGATVSLFHPRRQRWTRHFRWSENGAIIVGLTRVGRATIAALQMNHPAIVAARLRWASVGWHPPPEDGAW